MEYKRKYIDINSDPKKWHPDWEQNDFAWAVEQLETIPREKLIMVCKSPNINLTFYDKNWEKTTPDEQIIIALLTDYSPYTLVSVLKQI